MEHSHHGHETKKQTAWLSYLAATVVIGGFLIFINTMNCCFKARQEQNNVQMHDEDHGQHQDEHHGEGTDQHHPH